MSWNQADHAPIRHLRIWCDDAGESHLGEIAPEFTAVDGYAVGVPTVGVSPSVPAGRSYFLNLPRSWVGDFHPAPTRQYLSQLSGIVRVTVSDGTTVEAGAGTLWYIEDIAGRGHHTAVISDEDAICFVVTAPEGLEPANR